MPKKLFSVARQGRCFSGRMHFRGGRKLKKQTRQENSHNRVQNDHRPVASPTGASVVLCEQRRVIAPAKRAPVAVATEPASVYQANTSVLDRSGTTCAERRLFDRQKRTHFVAAGADHANRPGDNQEKKVAGAREGETRCGHQNGADDQHAPPPDPVGARREIERDHGIPDESQREKDPGLGFAEAQPDQVENQNNGQRPVGE